MSNPDRRPCHNKDFLRYNNIINGADWHNVPGSKKECVFKRKINESIFFKLYITHNIIFSSEKPYKKKKENSFSTWKRNSPNMFFSWKNKVSKCFHNTRLIKFSCQNCFFFFYTLTLFFWTKFTSVSHDNFFSPGFYFFLLMVSHTMFFKKSGYFSTHAILFTHFHIYENSLEKNVHIFSQILCALTKKVHT